MATVTEEKSLFDKSWNLYKKIVAADYMHHKRLMQLTAEEIRNMNVDHPINVLDIGCGDASPFIPLFDIRPVASYTGYDLSEVAIEYSRTNLSNTKVAFELQKGNMTDLILEESLQFDLIYSSYVIHHLSDLEKLSFFKAIAQKLTSGGIFIYIDIVRGNDESLEQYLEAYISKIKGWDILSSEEKKEVIDHITQFDFPAKYIDLLNCFSEAGFKLRGKANGDDKHLFFCMTAN